jgi:hypothetical protein
MVWYGAPPNPRQCVLSLKVVASCSVHPVSERHRLAVQSALVRRWVRPCDAGIGKEWNRGCLHATKSSGISLRCTCLALPATRWLDDPRERAVHRLMGRCCGMYSAVGGAALSAPSSRIRRALVMAWGDTPVMMPHAPWRIRDKNARPEIGFHRNGLSLQSEHLSQWRPVRRWRARAAVDSSGHAPRVLQREGVGERDERRSVQAGVHADLMARTWPVADGAGGGGRRRVAPTE